jgi:GNAT superfamily N-acetyltransferase
MASFAHQSPAEIIEFIDSNFGLFSSERADDFPANVLDGIARGVFAVITLEEGFAVAYKGRRFTAGPGGIEADLMFLFVDLAYEGRGLGTQLMNRLKPR